ncbi:SagB/ThcOx family dehydrogenase [Verrucomicrobium sp. 3C]|uniref:SagB/ThcOx family dehydrogenase n=1 Tax=Verrucomicrobium sp. 3C TaxID=1134055 RepID=UPI0003781869|nr:SagB/ThcOx family dehydrogenase [Verrucomicrobium sp. 3C]
MASSILAYHTSSKHSFSGYADSPGFLDWENQPDPFRRFEGSPETLLDLPSDEAGPCYDLLLDRPPEPAPLSLRSLSRFLYESLALSAWKQAAHSSPWSLRVNPSSGNLHPTEGYLLLPPLSGNESAGVFHYSPLRHSLEARRFLGADQWEEIVASLPPGTFFVGLSSIYWREAWKYGERAFRYCHHDLGHALATLALSARIRGWRSLVLPAVGAPELARILAVENQQGPEAEHADCLLAIFPNRNARLDGATRSFQLPSALLATLRDQRPLGDPNRLSSDHLPWPLLEQAIISAAYPGGWSGEEPLSYPTVPPVVPLSSEGASLLLRRRRSAMAMDGKASISPDSFLRILSQLLPRGDGFPFSLLPWRPKVSLLFFVHRVEGLSPGLYLLLRSPAHEASLRRELRPEFAWQTPPGFPDALPFCQLAQGDFRELAAKISCYQTIASGGCFALAMLADLSGVQERPWFYPRLFWECGLLGQLLYLGAEAAGLQGTGIGCYFDDGLHDLVGIRGLPWQSLYHFAVGRGVVDRRLQTQPAYARLRRAAD